MSFRHTFSAFNLIALSLGAGGLLASAAPATAIGLTDAAIASRSPVQQTAQQTAQQTSGETNPVAPPSPAESPLETVPGQTGSGSTVPDPLDPPTRPNDPSNNVNRPTGDSPPGTPPITTPGIPEGTAPAPTAPPDSAPEQAAPRN